MLTHVTSFVKYSIVSCGLIKVVEYELGTLTSVNGNSMQPTLNPFDMSQELLLNHPDFSKQNAIERIKIFMKNDIVLLNKWSVNNYETLNVGDIVVFKSPENPNKKLIKRILALPGDVHYDKHGDMYYIRPGHCWVEGDNRPASYDSKHFGPIPMGLIVGKVSYIVWPFARFGKIVDS